jgi:imidazolonepropionase-like amidohydrolase
MAQRQVGLVPTLINTARFPVFAERGHRFPRYAEHMLALHRRRHETVRAAHEAGVPVYAGTDAGSELPHGQIAREVLALHEAGLAPREALAAASWRAREWLRVPDGLSEGSVASFVVYPEDPLVDLAVLQHPSHVVLRGHVFRL